MDRRYRHVVHTFIYAWLLSGLASQARADQGETSPPSPTSYYGAIDLGARGVKAYLYSFQREGEGMDAQALFKDDVNTKLVSGAHDGQFTPAGITEATEAVSTLISEMKSEASKHGLAKVDYYIVGSSGVANFSNHDELKRSVDKATGLNMTFVDASQEGYYGLISAVPKARRPSSVLVDVGSGNTKLACLDGGKLGSVEIPYGSVTLRNAALKDNPDYMTGLTHTVDQKVRPLVTGCGATRRRMYWIGGAAWATATFTHPDRALWGYVPITRADLDSFLRRLQDNTWNQGDPRYAFGPDVTSVQRDAIMKAHVADRQRVQNVFSREDLLAGVSLMRSIVQGHSESPTLYFVRNGNYLFGYALEKFKQENTAEVKDDNASYFAGIDLGSRGVKAYIYSFVREAEGTDARSLFRDDINTKLVSAAKGNRLTKEGIAEATDAVVKLVNEMRSAAQERQIEPRFHLVASSGVAAFENHDELKKSIDQATGLSLDFVDVATEARDGLVSAIPATRRQDGFLVDIGSSNTKLGCVTGATFHSAEIPFGSVTLRNAARREKDYSAGLKTALDEVATAYKLESMNTPCLANRTRVYVIGGAPWATATFLHPEAALWGYVPLSRKEIDAFLRDLQGGTWNQGEARLAFAPAVSKPEREAILRTSTLDRQRVQDVFSREDLIAGVSLIRTILDSANPSAQIWFVRNGNYLFGYALEKYKDIRLADARTAGLPTQASAAGVHK